MLESLNDFFAHRRPGPLSAAWLSHKLQEAIEGEFKLKTKVIIRARQVVVSCPTQSEAAALNIQRLKLFSLLKRSGAGERRLVIKVSF